MSVCFKSFNVSHNFSRTAAHCWARGFYESNRFAFKKMKQVNDEEQLLRIFRSLYFEMKCNNNKRDSFDFVYQERLPLNVQSCKLYNNKYMIPSIQITNTEIFASISALVLKWLSRKVLFTNRKGQKKLLKSRLLFKKIANFTGQLLQNYK